MSKYRQNAEVTRTYVQSPFFWVWVGCGLIMVTCSGILVVLEGSSSMALLGLAGTALCLVLALFDVEERL